MYGRRGTPTDSVKNADETRLRRARNARLLPQSVSLPARQRTTLVIAVGEMSPRIGSESVATGVEGI
jgi:hypothetical protein